tara:strand:- start:1164 stop:2159 length:996 start_codon:yes stop_codon:yes gene_type:complete
MDIRTEKVSFINSLNLPEDEKDAISLAIDCLIDNESLSEDIPIVVTSYDDYKRNCVLQIIQKFCEGIYPNAAEDLFEPEILNIFGKTGEAACIALIKKLQSSYSMLYWADSPSWFSSLPSGLFHVISIEGNKVSRGLNQKNSHPTKVTRTYNDDTLIAELFNTFSHSTNAQLTNTKAAEEKFYDECNSGLIRPLPAPTGLFFEEEITISSPDWQKLACVAIRRYQSKECKDGMNWNISDQGWSGVVAYPLIEKIQNITDSGFRECLIGLITINIKDPKKPYLSTAWIHPFYRQKGKMKALWRILTEKYGELDVEEPNSNMQAFLKAVKTNA